MNFGLLVNSVSAARSELPVRKGPLVRLLAWTRVLMRRKHGLRDPAATVDPTNATQQRVDRNS